MLSNQDLLERIEDAERLVPVCVQCGSPTTVVERDDALWIECPTLGSRRPGLRSLLTLDFASLHTRRPIAAIEPAA